MHSRVKTLVWLSLDVSMTLIYDYYHVLEDRCPMVSCLMLSLLYIVDGLVGLTGRL